MVTTIIYFLLDSQSCDYLYCSDKNAEPVWFSVKKRHNCLIKGKLLNMIPLDVRQKDTDNALKTALKKICFSLFLGV